MEKGQLVTVEDWLVLSGDMLCHTEEQAMETLFCGVSLWSSGVGFLPEKEPQCRMWCWNQTAGSLGPAQTLMMG